MKYKDWLKNWLENYVKVSSKHRTYMNYSECVANHIVPNLGDYEINDLTPFEIQRFVTKLTECGNLKTGCGLSSSTVNGIITIIQSSLETAYVVGELKEYPAHSIKRPKLDEDEVRCFSVVDQKKIESAILGMGNKKQRMFGVILCLYTGLRIGELLALEWDDVDLVYGTIWDKNYYPTCNNPTKPCSSRQTHTYYNSSYTQNTKQTAQGKVVSSYIEFRREMGKVYDSRSKQFSFESKIPAKDSQDLLNTLLKEAMNEAQFRNIGFSINITVCGAQVTVDIEWK